MSLKKNFLIILSASILIIIFFLLLNGQSKSNKKIQVSDKNACVTGDYTGEFLLDEKLAFFEGRDVEVPTIASNTRQTNILGVSSEERYIEVDLSEQKLKAWDGSDLFLETAVSTGLPWYPTPQGEFRIWIKLKATKMEGGSGRYYYYLPNVPYVMYFQNDKVPGWRGYGLHGTYWHNDFGTPRSHGCVNLPTSIAEKLYYWTSPVLPEGKNVARASTENPGTRIVIHE
ncbi:hypothetical protein A2715_04115 [Candidatus Woesebacteria bacterium RIFCSPHIGHO2_01_FULL_39_32]|uniref:ErfK/YbiS/YcfS/YnhG family protein n=2 Tax=Candidatus Woeseibacteriota TaxID=1752722 RepID=A0A0G0S5X2_9BACT|nr:MAG: ErfK/YbiS/YcfS/YnhG family protein [Candidatus Woesebacteria bacterium GW2011_GWA1_39_8]OGM03548.1 MAG: hypothetical protein A2124_02895 [Candidatus Woesebacteria bacterium GWB1_37_5]OGM25206.1 MAG: hypothetical protein A2715_04115 [Candidatus Woesebacteria bacterium RIFCSPHIGHO2_01_FULL_39_32]OGM37706.1 MAG: hypothetical protein A3F01_01320 [Candidatus Woesebacteria bacterium RIFCSPHIGHO2_12_FULL_38_11]OGM64738.1 MAG: hypothetical protein A2893_03725 [Candidatus Woesebacteria bacterium